MPDHPEETARAARPRDVPRAFILRASPGDDRAAAPPWRALPATGPIGTTPPAPPASQPSARPTACRSTALRLGMSDAIPCRA